MNKLGSLAAKTGQNLLKDLRNILAILCLPALCFSWLGYRAAETSWQYHELRDEVQGKGNSLGKRFAELQLEIKTSRSQVDRLEEKLTAALDRLDRKDRLSLSQPSSSEGVNPGDYSPNVNPQSGVSQIADGASGSSEDYIAPFNRRPTDRLSSTSQPFSSEGVNPGDYPPNVNPQSGVSQIADGAGGPMEDWISPQYRCSSTQVAFSPDGTKLISGGYGTIKVWDVETGEALRSLSGQSERIFSMAFSADGSRIVSGSADKSVVLWDASSGKRLRTLFGHTLTVSCVTFSPGGKQVISGSWDGTIKVWDTATGEEVRTFSRKKREADHTDNRNIQSVAFSPDGKRLVTGDWSGAVTLWDVSTGEELRTSFGHSRWVYSVAFSPDGQLIASASEDETIKVWDTATGEVTHTLQVYPSEAISVVFSPDGKQIVSGSQAIQVWDTGTGQEVRSLWVHQSALNVALSPDGKQIAFESEHGITLLDSITGEKIRELSAGKVLSPTTRINAGGDAGIGGTGVAPDFSAPFDSPRYNDNSPFSGKSTSTGNATTGGSGGAAPAYSANVRMEPGPTIERPDPSDPSDPPENTTDDAKPSVNPDPNDSCGDVHPFEEKTGSHSETKLQSGRASTIPVSDVQQAAAVQVSPTPDDIEGRGMLSASILTQQEKLGIKVEELKELVWRRRVVLVMCGLLWIIVTVFISWKHTDTELRACRK